MDKDYLLEEVIESLIELSPFSETIIVQSTNEDERGLKKNDQRS